MKQLLFTLICFLCISCNKETNELLKQYENGIVEVSVYYKTKDNLNIQIPDLKSKLFIYYGKYSTELIDYTVQKGELVKEGKVLYPDQSITLYEKGKNTIHLDNIDKPFTIIIESNHYKKTTAYSYPSGEKKVTLTVVFGPFSE